MGERLNEEMTRRQLLAGVAGVAVAGDPRAARAQRKPDRFRYCLNTSTLMGQKLPISQVVDIAAKAGYDAIEPWIRELDEHVKGGGSLDDLRKRIADRGLAVESAI